METVRVKFIRGTSLGGGKDANPGEVVDLPRTLFAQYVQQGRVIQIIDTVTINQPAPPADATKTKRKAK